MANITDTYLSDIAFVTDFVKTPNGDLAQINGQTNVDNALFRRLVTVPGSLVHRPDYGVGIQRWQNRLNTLSSQRELANTIQEQFKRDPRVADVFGVLVENKDNLPEHVTITVRVKYVGQDSISNLKFIPFGAA
jgi:hypothetical protein